MAGVGFWEQRMQTTSYLSDKLFEPSLNARAAKVMRTVEDSDDVDRSKLALMHGLRKEHHLKALKDKKYFVDLKFEELVEKFKGREAMSCCDFWY
jgi:hypothetical protein